MKKTTIVIILVSIISGLILESCSPDVTANCPAYKYSIRGRRGR